MQAVLISIHPKFCDLIAAGKKTIEVRKTKPKLETPFKCYIYCTKPYTGSTEDNFYIYLPPYDTPKRVNGTVIGEFVCDRVDHFTKAFFDEQEPQDTEEIGFMLDQFCLTYSELCAYVGLKDFYGWHISELVIYDNPRRLSKFYAEGDCDCLDCKYCVWFDKGNGYNVEDDCKLSYKGAELHKSFKPIKRPPQSWMYVEEI